MGFVARSSRTLAAAILASAVLVGCGGEADVGEECDTSGAEDECVEGAICTAEGEAAVCRDLCADQADCASGEACNGVSGSNIKSCQPDTGKK